MRWQTTRSVSIHLHLLSAFIIDMFTSVRMEIILRHLRCIQRKEFERVYGNQDGRNVCVYQVFLESNSQIMQDGHFI